MDPTEWCGCPCSYCRYAGLVGLIGRHRDGNNWTGIEAPFARDIGANAKAVWIIAGSEETGGYGIYRWSGSGWEKVPGSAVRIGVGPSGEPWVVNNTGLVHVLVNGSFQLFSGGGAGLDIAVSPSGTPILIGMDNVVWGYNANSAQWQSTTRPGIAVAYGLDSKAWHLGPDHKIYKQK
jgi:hypothetical protein